MFIRIAPFGGGILLVALLSNCSNTNQQPDLQATSERITNTDPSFTNIYDKALNWAENGDERVLPLCDSLLKNGDAQTGASPYYYLGIYYAEKGDTARSIGFFDKTIITDYNFLEAYIEKAALLLALKRSEEAKKELELLRNIAPTYAPGHYWIGKVAEAQHKKEIAIYHYRLALSLDSSIVEARQGLQRLEK
jgi:tetratricopeptide (TPR) repeat protein